MDYHISRFTQTDLDNVYDLYQSQKDYTHQLRPDIEKAPYFSSKAKDELSSLLNSPNTLCLVVKNNNDIVGYLISYLMRTRESNDYTTRTYAFLDSIFVIESYRHNGIASSLLKEMKSYYRSINVKNIELYVLSNNTNAIKCYIENGFSNQSLRMELSI